MEIAIATVNRKEAADTAWENLKSKFKATVVNWVMEPIEVVPVGNEVMLQFGLALAPFHLPVGSKS